MSIEVRPVGVTCNLRCSYCYEQPVRDIDPVKRYNKAAAEQAWARTIEWFTKYSPRTGGGMVRFALALQSIGRTTEFVKQVEADRSDLLVIGSRELTKTERLHLGSVSETLLRHAPCSVLIVRGTRA